MKDFAATVFELFGEFSSEKAVVADGDVTRFPVNYGTKYSPDYAPFPGAWFLEIHGLPVEKPNFSTISTDFSTALFHRKNGGNIHFRLT